MGWTSGLPEKMETSSAHWDEMTFFVTSPNLGSLIRNAQSFVTTDRRRTPPHNTHLRGWAGDSGANVRDIGLLSSPVAGLVILCIYIPLNLLL